MNIEKSLNTYYNQLNDFQKSILQACEGVFQDIDEKQLKGESFINYCSDNGILDMGLTHKNSSEQSILLLFHSEFVEVFVLEYNYSWWPPDDYLTDKAEREKYNQTIATFVKNALGAKFITEENWRGEALFNSKIIWEDEKIESLRGSFFLFPWFYKKRKMRHTQTHYNSFFRR